MIASARRWMIASVLPRPTGLLVRRRGRLADMTPAMYSDYKKLIGATPIAFLVVVLATAGATSRPFEDADAAYSTSDYWARVRQSFPNGVPDAQHRFIAEAQYRLGMHYCFGKGVPQNYEEATKWFRLAADQGLDRAQFELGTAYEDGRGVPQSYADAEQWFRLAAGQGLDLAQVALGSIYSSGRGVPQNYDEAAKWYRRAADQGPRKSRICSRNPVPRWPRRTPELSRSGEMVSSCR